MGEIAPEEQFLPFSTIFYYLMLDFYVKKGIRISLRDKRLFEITEVEITRVDCTIVSNIEEAIMPVSNFPPFSLDVHSNRNKFASSGTKSFPFEWCWGSSYRETDFKALKNKSVSHSIKHNNGRKYEVYPSSIRCIDIL